MNLFTLFYLNKMINRLYLCYKNRIFDKEKNRLISKLKKYKLLKYLLINIP
jgi:hypothetical protein